jgi:hypothetical protein
VRLTRDSPDCGLTSICLATGSGHLPDLGLLATFAIGSFVMRGAGCTINDMWDRDIDSKVLFLFINDDHSEDHDNDEHDHDNVDDRWNGRETVPSRAGR